MCLISPLLFGVSASLDSLLVGISYGIRKVRIKLWQNLVISLITLLGTCLSVGLGHRLAPLLPEAISSSAGSLILILLGIYYIAKWVMTCLKSCRRKPQPHAAQCCCVQPDSAQCCCVQPDSAQCCCVQPDSAQCCCVQPDSAQCCCVQPDSAQCNCSSTQCNCARHNSTPPASPEAAASHLKPAEIFTLSLTLSLNNLSAGLSASLAGLTLIPTAVATLACSVLFLFTGNRLGSNPVLQIAGCAADPLSGALLIGLGIVQLFL